MSVKSHFLDYVLSDREAQKSSINLQKPLMILSKDDINSNYKEYL